MNNSKSKHQQRVEVFMHGSGQIVPDRPTVPDPKTCILRARLILEEALETIHALGCEAFIYSSTLNTEAMNMDDIDVHFNSKIGFDMDEVCDGCADVSVVTIGTLSACGIPDKELLRLVDENNLAKLTGEQKHDENGKLIKPENHEPPDITGFIASCYCKAIDKR